MATTNYKQRKQRLKEYSKKCKELLGEVDRNYLYNVMKEYQQFRQVDKLVECLMSALDTPEKLDLLVPIRNLLPHAHLKYYDKSVPYSKMAHPFVPPTHQSNNNTSPRAPPQDNQTLGPIQHRYDVNSMPNRGHHNRKKPPIEGQLRKYRSFGTLPTKPNARPKIVLDAGPSDISLRDDAGIFKVITIIRDMDESLGFSIRGGSEHGLGVFVSEVDAGSVADRAGLAPGDGIVEVNNVSFENLVSSSAVKVLAGSNRLRIVVKRIGKIPDFKFAREKTSWFDTGSRRLVEGELEDHGSMHNLPYINGDSERRVNMSLVGGQCLGFNIRGGSEYGVGIFVSKVDRAGLAEQLGMKPGDQIVTVNGVDFENISHTNAVDFIKAHDQLVITIRDVGKIPAYKEIYAEYDWIDGMKTRNSYRPYASPVRRTDIPLHLDLNHLEYLVTHDNSFELSPSSSRAVSEPPLGYSHSLPRSYPLLDDTSIGAPSISVASTSAGVQTDDLEELMQERSQTPVNRRVRSAVYNLDQPLEGSDDSSTHSEHDSTGQDTVVLQSFKIKQTEFMQPPEDIVIPKHSDHYQNSNNHSVSSKASSRKNRSPIHNDIIVAQNSDVTMVQRTPESQRSGRSGKSKDGKKRDKKTDTPRSVVGVMALQRENMDALVSAENTELFTSSPALNLPSEAAAKENEKMNDTWNEKDKSKKSRSLKEKLFGSKKGSSKVKSRKPLAAVNFSKKSKSKEKEVDRYDIESSPGHAGAGNGVFQKGLGSQLMLQEAMQQSALAMVRDTANKLLNEDEVAAVMRHIKRYEAERRVEDLTAPVLAILDKPEKVILLREIRGIIYPPDLSKFDSLVSRQEMAAYEELSIKMDEDYEGNFELKSKSKQPRISSGSANEMELGQFNGIASKEDQVFFDEKRAGGVYEIRRDIGSTKIYKAMKSGGNAVPSRQNTKTNGAQQNGSNFPEALDSVNHREHINQNNSINGSGSSVNRDSNGNQMSPHYETLEVQVHASPSHESPSHRRSSHSETSAEQSEVTVDYSHMYASVNRNGRQVVVVEDHDTSPLTGHPDDNDDSASTISSCSSSSAGGEADSYDLLGAHQVSPREYDPHSHLSSNQLDTSTDSFPPPPSGSELDLREEHIPTLNSPAHEEINSDVLPPPDFVDSPAIHVDIPLVAPPSEGFSPPPSPLAIHSKPSPPSPELTPNKPIRQTNSPPSSVGSVRSLRDVQKNRRSTLRSSPVAPSVVSSEVKTTRSSPSPTAVLMATVDDLDNHLKDWDSVSSSTLQDHDQQTDDLRVYTHAYDHSPNSSVLSRETPREVAADMVDQEQITLSPQIAVKQSPVFHAPPPPSSSPPPENLSSVAVGTSELSYHSGNESLRNGWRPEPLTINVKDDWESPLGDDTPPGSDKSTPLASPVVHSPTASYSISTGGSNNSSAVSTPREIYDSPTHQAAPPSPPATITVTLRKTKASLGVSISGGKDSRKQPHIRVEKVFDGGAAADSGVLKSGMQLLSINGESMASATHTEAVNMIRRAYANKREPTMTMQLLPAPQ